MYDLVGAIISLIAAAFGAITIVYTRTLSQRLHNSVVSFYYGLGNLFFTPLWVLVQERSLYPRYEWGMVGLMVAIGAIYSLMQLMMVNGSRLISATMAGILLYVTVPCSYILEYFFFGKKIGYLEIIGALIIVGTNITVGVLKGKGIIG